MAAATATSPPNVLLLALYLVLALLMTGRGACGGRQLLATDIARPASSSDAADLPSSSTPSTFQSFPAAVTPNAAVSYAVYGSHSGTGTSTYWSNNLARVPPSLSLVLTLAKVFGSRIIKFVGNALTLLAAIRNHSTQPMAALAREATVSLLNAYTSPGFPVTPQQVLSIVNDALGSTDDQLTTNIQDLTEQFQLYNEAV